MFEKLFKLFIKDHDDIENEAVRERYGSFSGFVGIAVNLMLASIKLVAGLLSLSISIVADALNNISDAGASLVSVVSFKLASKPADREHPFGHARIEYVASMIVSFLILVVGFESLSSAVKSAVSFISGSGNGETVIGTLTFVILAISVIMKLLLASFYRYAGNKINSSVLKASAVDSVSDAISTAAVLVSFILIGFTGWYILDSLMGAAVSILILVAGLRILNETKNSLLGDAPVESTVEKIKEIVKECPYIIGMHDLLVHNYGPNRFIASFHAEVDGNGDIFVLHDAIDNVERDIQTRLGILCTIHMDPVVTDDEAINSLRSFVEDTVKELGLDLGIHDFRVVIGETHTNLIFDIVVPFERTNAKEICELLERTINEKRSECFAVITVDRG